LDVDLEDRETLINLATTSMRSKTVAASREHLAGLVIDAIKQIIEERDGEVIADVDNVQIVKKEGRSLDETELVRGIIIDKEVVHAGMPKKVEGAKIALIDAAIEVEKTEFDAEIRIRSPDSIKAFLDQEAEMLKKMVDRVGDSGANVLFCQKGIDDVVQHHLAKAGIIAVRRAKKSDMEKLAKATGGKIVSNLADLKESDLGLCELVEERKVGDDKMVFVEGCNDPRTRWSSSKAVMTRGPSPYSSGRAWSGCSMRPRGPSTTPSTSSATSPNSRRWCPEEEPSRWSCPRR